jgi:hypothetical protein
LSLSVNQLAALNELTAAVPPVTRQRVHQIGFLQDK